MSKARLLGLESILWWPYTPEVFSWQLSTLNCDRNVTTDELIIVREILNRDLII